MIEVQIYREGEEMEKRNIEKAEDLRDILEIISKEITEELDEKDEEYRKADEKCDKACERFFRDLDTLANFNFPEKLKYFKLQENSMNEMADVAEKHIKIIKKELKKDNSYEEI